LKLFHKDLFQNVLSKEVFGGEFKLQKFNAVERFVISRIKDIKEDVTCIFENNVNFMAEIYS